MKIEGHTNSFMEGKMQMNNSSKFIRDSHFLSRISFFSTIPKLRQECELRMITDHLEFLHSDCKEMVSQEKRVDLHNMYVLLKPIPDGLKTLIQAFLDHIKNEGIETISTLKGDMVKYD